MPSKRGMSELFGNGRDANGREASRSAGRSSGPGTTGGLPFATSDGQTKGDPSNVPPYRPPNRSQGEATSGAPPADADVTAQSRTQQIASYASRVNAKSVPGDGSAPDNLPTNLSPDYRRQTTGSVGSTLKPFKGLK